MRFCGTCGRVMKRDASTGVVVFKCHCGYEEKGDPADARIKGEFFGTGEITEMYTQLIRSAAFDRTNQLVKKDCPDCGLDYMTQVRVGEAEIIIYTCKCGYILKN